MRALPTAILAVYPLASKPMMMWFTEQYFRTPADGSDPRIDLVDANLKGLPPTTLINAGIDPLLSDGSLLGDRLKAAGVATEQKTYGGMTHEFFGLGALVGGARDAESYAASRLKSSFGVKAM